ncbi:MAG: hypothetical protein LBQ24_05580 [Candidatus Peribacteria bacterium]|nr:hypothetical protein [Candidatus Peribacteria bacterium]
MFDVKFSLFNISMFSSDTLKSGFRTQLFSNKPFFHHCEYGYSSHSFSRYLQIFSQSISSHFTNKLTASVSIVLK